MYYQLGIFLVAGSFLFSAADDCGRPEITPKSKTETGRIIGGTEANPGSLPWTVALGVKIYGDSADLNYVCGAAIINSNWLLTAAHCVVGKNNLVQSPSSLSVRMGHHHLNLPESLAATHNIKQVIVHENYRDGKVPYDIALLQVDGSISFNQRTKPVCLPNVNSEPIPGTDALAAGWGATLYNSDTNEGLAPSSTLRQVAMHIVSRAECAAKPAYVGDIKDDMICAGGVEGKDTCSGDSGGPLVVQDTSGRYVLEGIVSWGRGCAIGDYPGVYVRTGAYVNWINEKMLENNSSNTLATGFTAFITYILVFYTSI